MRLDNYALYTDGACSGNPGPGGWAAIALATDPESETPKIPLIRGELAGGDPATTNNRMELTAVLEALRHEPKEYRQLPLTVHTDSQYLVKAFTEGWLDNWQRKGWRTAKGKEVENKGLWQQLAALVQHRPALIHWNWVKGHSGDAMNDMADRKAVLYAQQARREKEPFQEGTLIFARSPLPPMAANPPPAVIEGSCRELPEQAPTELPAAPPPAVPLPAPAAPLAAETEPSLPATELSTAEKYQQLIDPTTGTSPIVREDHVQCALAAAERVEQNPLPGDRIEMRLHYPDRSSLLLYLQCIATAALPGPNQI